MADGAIPPTSPGIRRHAGDLGVATRFKPGQSGNPGGRSKRDRQLAELARVHTVDAIAALVEIMRNANAPAAARCTAAAEILDRGWGRAPASLEATHEVSFAADLEAFIRSLQDKGPTQMIEVEGNDGA